MNTSDLTRITSYAKVYSKPIDAFSEMRKLNRTQNFTELHRVTCVMKDRKPVGFVVETQSSLAKLHRNLPSLSFHVLFPKNTH